VPLAHQSKVLLLPAPSSLRELLGVAKEDFEYRIVEVH